MAKRGWDNVMLLPCNMPHPLQRVDSFEGLINTTNAPTDASYQVYISLVRVFVYWELVRQKQVSRAGTSSYILQIRWDVITCRYPCDLVLTHKSRGSYWRLANAMLIHHGTVCCWYCVINTHLISLFDECAVYPHCILRTYSRRTPFLTDKLKLGMYDNSIPHKSCNYSYNFNNGLT